MLLADIMSGIPHTPHPLLTTGTTVTAITADSRAVQPGGLFVCLHGLSADGHRFAAMAADRGAAAIVANRDRLADLDLGRHRLPVLGVDDTRQALGHLASAFYERPGERLTMIGLTGTNGKTTTSFLLESILKAAGANPGVIGTINYRYNGQETAASFTTPEAVELQRLLREMVDQGVTHVIMEVSSHALAMHRIAGLGFQAALFTNLTRDHLDFHADMESYYQAKRRLFADYLRPGGVAVVVVDEADTQDGDWGHRLLAEIGELAPTETEAISCALEGGHTVSTQGVAFGLDSTTADLLVKGRPLTIRTSLVGRFNLKNTLGAIGVAVGLGVRHEAIVQGLAAPLRVPGRLELVPGAASSGSPAVFVDYAHTPDALENVLATLRALQPRRLLVVFGCGGDRDPGKRPMMGEIAGRLAEVVIVTADNSRSESTAQIMAAIEGGVRQAGMPPLDQGDTAGRGYLSIPSRAEAIARAIHLATAGDIVLISGKGHETYQILGAQTLFFDDRLEAAKCLAEKAAPQVQPGGFGYGLATAQNPSWTLEQILAATGGRLAEDGKDQGRMVFRAIATDSRTIEPGDVFLALSGEKFDGLSFAGQAINRGAAAIIGERVPEPAPARPVVLVPDSLRALGDLAAYRRRLMDRLTVVAVTGSSGKTTVKEMTAAILERRGRTLKTQGNFNNLVGLPLSLLPVGFQHAFAMLEMGMNVPGEIARLTEIADPDVACINNVQPAHLQGLGSVAGVAKAKGELFQGCRPEAILALNLEDPWVRKLAKGLPNRQVTFGFRRGADVRATRIRALGQEGLSFTLHVRTEQQRVRLAIIGRHNALNALAAAAMALAAGATLPHIVAGLEAFRPGDNRLGRRTLASGLRVINDSYNANPASVAAALAAVAMIRKEERTMAVLGDMLELGEHGREAHAGIGREVARQGFDFLLALGEHAEVMAQAARQAGMPPSAAQAMPGKAEAAARITALLTEGRLRPGDLVLVKGSRGMRMEEVLSALGG